MSQSLANVLIHIVFSTKDRVPFLEDRNLRSQMHSELGGTSRALDCTPLIVGGVADHIHLLARQSRTISLSEWVKELKRVTSIWIKKESPSLKVFAWQSGYGAFSVSQSQAEKVIQYIREQEAHHRTRDFQAEFRELLQRHNMEFDERYVWD